MVSPIQGPAAVAVRLPLATESPLAAPAPRGLVMAASLVTFLWLDALRVWLPSVIFIFGDAGSTPATVMGAFAAVWFLIPLVAAPLMGRVRPRRVWVAATVTLVAARLMLQATSGGTPQLSAATAAVTAGSLALVALAAGAASGHRARVGVLLGLGADVSLRAALGTVGLAWWSTQSAWLAVIALGVLAVVAAMTADVPHDPARPLLEAGAAWPWLVLGPAVVLVGVLSGVPARAALATGWSPGVVAGVLASAHLLGVALAAFANRLAPAASGTIGAVAVALGTVLALEPARPAGLVGQCLVALGMGWVVAAGGASGTRGRATRAAVSVAVSLLILLAAAFLYYAAYDIVLPFPNRAILLVVGSFVAVLGLLGAAFQQRIVRSAPERRRTRQRFVVAVTAALATALLAGLAAASDVEPEVEATGYPVQVMLYNLHMGFDIDGRLSVDDLAAVLRDENPDVVVLNEVDRGWLLNGGQDILQLLAHRLEMRAVFAPAADEVWGNAILTRLPVAEATIERLPRGGAPMARSAVAVVLDLEDGSQLGVIGTHLHHVADDGDVRLGQTRALAAMVQRLRERNMPVAVLGDLNAQPGDPELEPLMELLEDALDRPAPTFPSWGALEEIDHLMVTPDLVVEDVRIPDSQASDHLPITGRLSPAS